MPEGLAVDRRAWGWPIVKAIAEAHGGTGGVEDARPAGADFWIQLPAA